MEFVFTSTSLLLAVYWICPLELVSIAVSYGARLCSDHTKSHWRSKTRIMRYLKGNANLGSQYTGKYEQASFRNSDSDWAGDMEDSDLLLATYSSTVELN